MGKLERITVTMPEEMAAKLRAAVGRGDYATTSEVVREALRVWNAKRERREAEDAEIRATLDTARAGGRKTSEEVFAAAREAIVAATAPHKSRRAG